MTRTDIALQRLRNERLIGTRFAAPEAAVRWLTAVQAQDFGGAKWAVGQRVRRCVDADVEQAYSRGAILRTHVMRPTWHFVMPEDIRWLLTLTAPRVKQTMAYYDRKLELDAATFKRAGAVIVKALRDGKHRTRAELSGLLAASGIAADGQRLGHVLMRAEQDAVVCSGAMRGRQHTYALLDERAPSASVRSRDDALAELTHRYFASHGPAMAQDFAWWSGLTVADANAGIAMNDDQLTRHVVEGRTYWACPPVRKARLQTPTLHLLPNYDEYLIAYRDHSASFDKPATGGSRAAPMQAALYDMLARHIVVLDGRVIGGWRNVPATGETAVETRLFVTLDDSQKQALTAAAAAYSSFIGVPVKVREQRA
jgi:hypothetical protein